jgi:peptidoglycan/xylan/chitin deacetylase (PgdA/CDA1 family)
MAQPMLPFRNNWTHLLALKFFLLVLVCAAVFALWQPGLWMWALGAVVANHFLLTIAGLIPRSKLLGPNLTRLPEAAAQRGEVSITIDDGPEPAVTPQVLDILDHHQAKATFFCIARKAAQHPELCREIIRRGHTIENHSHAHHWYFSLLGPWNIYRDIQAAQQVLGDISGQTPRFFRPPAGLRNPTLQLVLERCGLRLCTWSKRGFDTRNGDADAVLASLTRDIKGGDILLLHDGNAAIAASGNPVILDVLPGLLDRLKQANLQAVTLSAALT